MSGEIEKNQDMTAEDIISTRHRKERKELQAEIQKLKNSISKGDKKKKREVTAQIAVLESQLEEKHLKELEDAKKESESKILSEKIAEVNITDHSDESSSAASTNQQEQRVSKSQKRRAKKAQKEAEASERIRQGELESVFSERRIEADKFEKILSSRNLKMRQVPSDGDCLYAAFVHQLSLHKINTSVANLRKQTADYMRGRVDEFLPFFVKEETGDLFTEEEYLEYCNKVELTPEWGGQAELRALSDTLTACVEVIQAGTPSVFIGSHFKDPVNIVVTYHRHAYGLGEHYNSVEPAGKAEQAKTNGFKEVN